MKLVRFSYKGNIGWGRLEDDMHSLTTNHEGTRSLRDFAEVIEFFNQQGLDALLKDHLSLFDVLILAPVLPSKNILCIGKNYHDHILEFDGTDEDISRVKEHPIFFSKTLSSVIGPRASIHLHPEITKAVDYEAELAVIIGKTCFNVQEENALEFVYGYTCLNDVTARDLQKTHQQWMRGKGLDTHCPIGPWLVTADAIEDPQNLVIQSSVNGERRQDANTKLMMHSIASMISILSQGMTLNPGDVIATGTPKGVGMGFHPPKFLKAGDEVEIFIEGIGSLINTVE